MNEAEIKFKIIIVAAVIMLAVGVFIFLHFRARWVELKEAKRVIDSVVPVDAVVINEEDPFTASEKEDSPKELTSAQKAMIAIGVIAAGAVIIHIMRNRRR